MKNNRLLQMMFFSIVFLSLILPAPVLAHADHEHVTELEMWIARIGILAILGSGVYVIRTTPTANEQTILENAESETIDPT